MYSVILMAAMTTGGEAPSFGLCKKGWCCAPVCYTACYGCYGCAGCYGCGGCYGCYGCVGYSCVGCYGCYGVPTYSCFGCLGGVGCYGVYAAAGYAAPEYSAPVPPSGEPLPAPVEAKKVETARVILDVPTDAKVYFDGQLMSDSAAKRQFYTPKLEKGQAYYYIVKMEVERDGKPVVETKRLIVRAGDVVKATFADPAPNAASIARR